jgi:DNA-binding NarL/FixJ family response regulator
MRADPSTVTEMLQAGADGYLLKSSSPQELTKAIDAVMRGGTYMSPSIATTIVDHHVRGQPGVSPTAFSLLTPREREVLQLIAEGKTSKEAGKLLHISSKTVETHRAQIAAKLGIKTLAELTKYAIRHGLTSLDQ